VGILLYGKLVLVIFTHTLPLGVP